MYIAVAYVLFFAILGYNSAWKSFLAFFGLPVILLCGLIAYDVVFVLPEAEKGSGAGIGLGILIAFWSMVFGAALFTFFLFTLIGKLVRSYSEG